LKSRVHKLAAAALLILAALAPAAHAAEFRCVGDDGAILYDAPSREATPLYVASQYYPLEIITQTEAWAKVRDQTGALSWVEKKSLGEKHMVVVTAPRAEAHQRAEDAAPVSFSAVQDVALELVGVLPGGWLHVRHADGAEGWLRSSLVWGG
jgi:SH3-like domain-containing protein